MYLFRRRLTPAPCWEHPSDMCACTRPAAGWTTQRAWYMPAFRFQRRSTAAPNNVCKTRSSSDDLLSLLARLLLTVRSIVSSSVLVGSRFCCHEFCCGSAVCHTAVQALSVWHRQPQISQLWRPQPCLSYNMLVDGRESVVGQSEALAYSRPTPVDTFIRTRLYLVIYLSLIHI